MSIVFASKNGLMLDSIVGATDDMLILSAVEGDTPDYVLSVELSLSKTAEFRTITTYNQWEIWASINDATIIPFSECKEIHRACIDNDDEILTFYTLKYSL